MGERELYSARHILLTGRPGTGKTTVIIKVCELLANMKVPVSGFYTKELRSGSIRSGFDIFSLDNTHGPLARRSSDRDFSRNERVPRVGNYAVDLQSFESIALPALSDQNNKAVMVIDEIGKMELFSKPFENKVKELYRKTNLIILATVPNKGAPIPIVETLKKLPTATLIEVDLKNRNHLPEKIATSIRNEYSKIYKD